LRDAAVTRPQDVAIQVDDQCVSFADLNLQADCLAQRLIEEASAGARIALRANGTHASAVGFVAIQRAGMVSVPVDPTAPAERVRQILADVEAAVLLSDVEDDDGLHELSGHPLNFGAQADPLPIDLERGELVSIVYTSGSTGTPKGIMCGREQTDETFAMLPHYGISAGSRLGGLVGGTVGYIERLIGAALFLQEAFVSYEIRRHGIVPLGPWLEREHIAAFVTVPTVLRHLLSTLPPEQRFPDLRTVVLGGETSTWEDVVRLRAHLSPHATIVNAFGLTEAAGIASVFITSQTSVGSGPLPAGHPAATAKVTIVGADGGPVAPGERGEIVVEGPGCALGYWRRPDLTAAVFTVMPSGHRRVRTGDGGRIRPDGMLEHLGRIDFLVKISGNRVELGEVESALAQLDGVTAAAAATYTDEADSTRLTACVTANAGTTLDPRLLRAALSRRLPGYMIPDHIAVVDELPQLAGGKADRERVAELRFATGAAADPEGASPRSALERSLAQIWSDVLEVEEIGLNDSFFDLGGDSIRAARVFVELERRCGIDRPVSLLAEAPTIASLAHALDEASDWSSLLVVQTSGTRPPLFVVHDGTGSLLFARSLAAALGPDQPVYGIRCEGLNGEPLPQRSFEELAAAYIKRIRAPYPHGPYVLYGVSMGGVIAVEMARQMIEAGEVVPLVALGDSRAPTGIAGSKPVSERLRVRLTDLAAMPARDRMGQLARLLKRQAAHRISRTRSAARTERRLERMLMTAMQRGDPVPPEARGRHALRQYGALMLDYRPRPPFPERVLLLRTEGPGALPDRGWEAIVGEALEIVDVPGTHTDLGRELASSNVGSAIGDALNHVPQPVA
jgi:acyl-coenzyme A synthetase/AMP-(fatty) acid ligase/thioesterase domain-containing protein/acyl carrier protein